MREVSSDAGRLTRRIVGSEDAPVAGSARQFLRDAGGTIVSRGLLVAIGLGTSIVLARGLGPAGRGEFAVATALASIGIQLASVGVHTASAWSIARDRALLGSLIANGVVVSVMAGGGLAVAVYFASAAFPSLVPVPLLLLALALLSIPVGIANLVGLNLMLGLGRVRDFNLIELGQRAVAGAAIGLLVLTGAATATTAFGAFLVSSTVVTAAALWSLAKAATEVRRPDSDLFRTTAAYGLRSYLAALFTFLVLRADVIIIQSIIGERAAGEYAVAVSLAELVYLVPSTIATLLFPWLTSMADAGQRWATARRWALIVGGGTLLVVPLGLILGTSIITLLYGSDFAPGANALVWLLPGTVFLSVQNVVSHYLYAVGAPSIVLTSPLVGAALNVGLNLTLIATHGISGAAFASAAAYGVMLVMSGAYFIRSRPDAGHPSVT